MRTTLTVLLATRSAGKLRELVPLLSGVAASIETLDQAGIRESADEELLEQFDTFEANALAKARWFRARRPDRLVIADDSGLEVDALHGAPGVHSKRWSGRTDVSGPALDDVNNAYLQQQLEVAAARGESTRRARYVCAAACVWSGGEFVLRGETHGTLVDAPRGRGGFGYDPYFFSDELQATFGEVTLEQKARVSHRARAFVRVASELVRLRAIDGLEAKTP